MNSGAVLSMLSDVLPADIAALIPPFQPDLSAPVFKSIKVHRVHACSRLDCGIEVLGDCGSGNIIVYDEQQSGLDLKINFCGSLGSVIIIGKSSPVSGTITVKGNYSLCCCSGIGGAQGYNRLNLNLEANGGLIPPRLGF
ncbi:hypothetical protein, partial [Methylobacterium tarhaniae]|uniref:hypothetical protein n=1 Tax=Methylobacterium tarhaniae TaxID=1187852 RepID=UPI001ABF7F8D